MERLFDNQYRVERLFPYPSIRPHQEQIIGKIVDGLQSGRVVIVEAANGTGKTISTLSALLSYTKRENRRRDEGIYKIVYLTRTNNQANRVIDELTEINDKIKVTGISMRGRSHMCINEDALKRARNNSELIYLCDRLKKHKNCKYHINAQQNDKIVLDLISQPADANLIKEEGEANNCCPDTLAKNMTAQVEVIAGPYHYLFDK